MPRLPRIELADAIHHVTARAPSGRWLFADDLDHETYLELLAGQVQERKWDLFHYCLMGNHLHLLLRTPEPNLGAGIKAVHERFATYVNRRRAEHGHVFGDRYYNGIVVQQRHLEACMRYIARNPVAAGLCRQPGEWRWSAHNALVGAIERPTHLDVTGALSLVHDRQDAGQEAYERWVELPDLAVLATLEATMPGDTWLVSAVDGHRMDVSAIAEFAGLSQSQIYRRLRAARATEGTVP